MEKIVTMKEKKILEKALWMLTEEFIASNDNGQITKEERAKLVQYKVLETINNARRKISGTNK